MTSDLLKSTHCNRYSVQLTIWREHNERFIEIALELYFELYFNPTELKMPPFEIIAVTTTAVVLITSTAVKAMLLLANFVLAPVLEHIGSSR